MKLVLDTCAILWAVADPEKLSSKAARLLTDPGAEIRVSPMSCAEIACLAERGRIRLDRHWKLWFRTFVERNGWEVTPVDLPLMEEAYSLPGEFHRDPVDRILVATARLFQATLITGDKLILDYPHVQSAW